MIFPILIWILTLIAFRSNASVGHAQIQQESGQENCEKVKNVPQKQGKLLESTE